MAAATAATRTKKIIEHRVDPRQAALVWQARSLELARVHGQLGRAVSHGMSISGCEIFSVPSLSGPQTHRIVRYHVEARQIECLCPAASNFHRPCGHAGAVLHIIQEREAQRERERRDYWDWVMEQDWEEKAARGCFGW